MMAGPLSSSCSPHRGSVVIIVNAIRLITQWCIRRPSGATPFESIGSEQSVYDQPPRQKTGSSLLEHVIKSCWFVEKVEADPHAAPECPSGVAVY
jgi:hypothetical protein